MHSNSETPISRNATNENSHAMKKAARDEQHWREINRMCSQKFKASDPIDRDRLILENSKLMVLEIRAYQDTETGCEAFERLLALTESGDPDQTQSIAKFLAVIWGASLLDPSALSDLDPKIGDDCIAVLNALRWGRLRVSTMVADANVRVPRTLRAWHVLEPEASKTAGFPR